MFVLAHNGYQKSLIILRGLPGSGKSTLARQLVGPNGIICCTDDYFYVNGNYVYDPTKLPEYHQKNQEKARLAMATGKNPVIIDNTNVAAWQMKPYVLMGREFKYNIKIMEPDTEWKFDVEQLERRNTHGISQKTLERMCEQYEKNVTVEDVLQS